MIWPFNPAKPESREQTDKTAALLSRVGPTAVEILRLSTRAPSGHNAQPWTIRVVDPEHWIIGIEESRRLPGVDPTARETLLSLGAFLENFVRASEHFGYTVDYDVIAHAPIDADVIDLRLRKAIAVAQPLNQIRLDQIRLRRTVRNGYLVNEIKSADLASILGQGEAFHYFPKGSAAAQYLAEGTIEANRQQAFRDPAEEELANWIRWSADDAAKYRNGLTPASMEIEGLAGWYVSHFYNHANVMSKSFRETTIQQVQARVREGGGWLVVTSSGNDTSTLIETGRNFQRMWLRLRDKKMAIHPMTQMLEEVPWRENVAKHLGLDGAPQFILRIGYINTYPDPTSLRMPPSWITTFAA